MLIYRRKIILNSIAKQAIFLLLNFALLENVVSVLTYFAVFVPLPPEILLDFWLLVDFEDCKKNKRVSAEWQNADFAVIGNEFTLLKIAM